jgi:hypothetical protein
VSALVESGRIAELILLLVALEALAFALLGRRVRGLELGGLAGTLAAGAALLLALRAALRAEPWTAVAGWLALAGVAHAADLLRRWRGSDQGR